MPLLLALPQALALALVLPPLLLPPILLQLLLPPWVGLVVVHQGHQCRC